jgi:hypothetical protein
MSQPLSDEDLQWIAKRVATSEGVDHHRRVNRRSSRRALYGATRCTALACLILAASLSACSRRDPPTNDASVASSASTDGHGSSASASATDATVSPDASARLLADDARDAGEMRDTGSREPGTIRLLVERVVTRNMGRLNKVKREPPLLGYDLLAIHAPATAKDTTRIHPSCPRGNLDAFAMCKRFRSCMVSGGDASVDDAAADAVVTCDGRSFSLVQHDGMTYLKTEEGEILVVRGMPTGLAPTSRERTALLEAP